MWGAVILIFVGLWGVQIILTYFQSKHYKETIKQMSKHSSGYLGVGVAKQKLGVGSVIILVCDLGGKIIQAKELTGVTVFTRFKPAAEFVGQSIDVYEQKASEDPTNNRNKAITMAVANIKKQKQKEIESYNESTNYLLNSKIE